MPELKNPIAESLEDRLKVQAHFLGFELVGITEAAPSAFAEEYRAWLDAGYAGEMAYLSRNIERRLDPRLLLPGARSLIMVGMNYYTEAAKVDSIPDSDRAIFARYALGDDYHEVMTERLKRLLIWLQAESAESVEGRVYVDAGPLLEREAAQRAGLGWFGKNTLLINTRRGSYFFLGALVTTASLVSDTPSEGGCGTCRRCLDACPTGAIVTPYKVDSRLCISYLTIEQKGAIPEELAPALSSSVNRIYGCDICQEVCPFNRTAAESHHPTLIPTEEPAFQPREATINSKVTDLLYMTDEEFRIAFKNSPIKRAKRRGLLRNAAAALSARNNAEAIAALEHALNDPEPLVREQAAHSLETIRRRHNAREHEQ